mmetsp:Transcript_18603/g.30061  ORF Transcript_18603/g.30061 Transcript_18603/m.30061 type:complete len:220 (-) Transcript_18603:530-1189(-)
MSFGTTERLSKYAVHLAKMGLRHHILVGESQNGQAFVASGSHTPQTCSMRFRCARNHLLAPSLFQLQLPGLPFFLPPRRFVPPRRPPAPASLDDLPLWYLRCRSLALQGLDLLPQLGQLGGAPPTATCLLALQRSPGLPPHRPRPVLCRRLPFQGAHLCLQFSQLGQHCCHVHTPRGGQFVSPEALSSSRMHYHLATLCFVSILVWYRGEGFSPHGGHG